MIDLSNVKVGDTLLRHLTGAMPHEVKITNIDNGIIAVMSTEPVEEQIRKIRSVMEILGFENKKEIELPFWTFSQTTGGEIDEDLGWDGINTGSYLKFKE